MREAPALAGVTGNRPKPATPRRSKPRGSTPPWRSSLLGRAFARPGVTVAGAAFAALMTVIVVNATFFQKGHRPIPLFGGAHQAEQKPALPPIATPALSPAMLAPAPMTATPPVQDAAPLPPAPTPVPAQSAATKPAPATPQKAAAVRHDHGKAASPKHTDSIAKLLGGTGATGQSAAASKAAPSHAAAPKAVKPQVAKPRPAVEVGAAKPQN